MGRSMSIRCFVPDAGAGARGDVVTLSADESHHVSRVLRVAVDDVVVVFDGAGREWTGTVVESARDRVRVRLSAERTPVPEPRVAVTLAIGLLKGDAMSDVIRDATMLGVAAVVPFVSDHTALPEEAWRARHADRWARVAVASSKQCGRAVVPRVQDVTRFEEALDAGADLRVMCVEPAAAWGEQAAETAGEAAPPPQAPQPGSRVTLFVGPEGGWSTEEMAVARKHDVRLMTLGPRTLRAEIAPAIALAALWTTWGWEGGR